MSIQKELSIFFVNYNLKEDIEKLVKKIPNDIKVIIVDNSNNQDNINNLSKIKNLTIIKNKNNSGQVGGINSGLRNIKTKYAIYSDVDVDFDWSEILKFYSYVEKFNKDDFGIIVPQHPWGSQPNSHFHEKKFNDKYTERMKIVTGHFILFNMKIVKKYGGYDDNYWMYYDETDYCLKLDRLNIKILTLLNTNIPHKGHDIYKKSYTYKNTKYERIILLRHWHMGWSKFYFFKKNYSYFFALKKTFKDLIFAVIKCFAYLFIDNYKFLINYNKLTGLINSFFLKESWKRPEHYNRHKIKK
tara:strand:+ start:530 stop:1429 length:900 start_codon:yes stop_codon:yes gene_type:complete